MDLGASLWGFGVTYKEVLLTNKEDLLTNKEASMTSKEASMTSKEASMTNKEADFALKREIVGKVRAQLDPTSSSFVNPRME